MTCVLLRFTEGREKEQVKFKLLDRLSKCKIHKIVPRVPTRFLERRERRGKVQAVGSSF